MCCILRNTWQNFDPRLKLPSPPNRLPENHCFLCVGWGLLSGLVMAKRKDLCGLSSGRSTHGVLCQWWSVWFIKCLDATGCFCGRSEASDLFCVCFTDTVFLLLKGVHSSDSIRYIDNTLHLIQIGILIFFLPGSLTVILQISFHSVRIYQRRVVMHTETSEVEKFLVWTIWSHRSNEESKNKNRSSCADRFTNPGFKV